jgi:hypothetical protein
MSDPRIPVMFGARGAAGAEDGLLLEGRGTDGPGVAWFSLPKAAHVLGCACCPPRNAAGQALGRLFLARARGESVFFRRVVAVVTSEAGRAAVLAALEGDPLASAAFRGE